MAGTWRTQTKAEILYFTLPDFLSHTERAERGGSAPLVVLRDGRVADASEDARQAGVKRGQPEAQARQACPCATYVPYEAARYRPHADAVMEAAYSLSPVVEPHGEASAWLLLGAGQDPRAFAARLAEVLLPRFAGEILVGVGPNPWTAQLAATAVAPRRGECLLVGGSALFSRIAAGSAAETLAPIPVAALERVLPGVAERLRVLGLHTFGEVTAAPAQELRRALGEEALAAQGYCRGEDGRRVRALWPRPTVSRSAAFVDPLENLETVARALDGLAARLGEALRERGQAGREIALEVVSEDGRGRRTSRRFSRPRADESVRHALHLLWAGEIWPGLARGSRGQPLRISRIEASVADLCARPWAQVPIWETPAGGAAGRRAGAATANVAQPARTARSRPTRPARPVHPGATALAPDIESVLDGLRARFPGAGVGIAAEGAGGAGDWRERRLAFWDPYRSGGAPSGIRQEG